MSVSERLNDKYNKNLYLKNNIKEATLEFQGHTIEIPIKLYYIAATVFGFEPENKLEEIIKAQFVEIVLRALLGKPYTIEIDIEASAHYVTIQKEFRAFIAMGGIK